MAGKWGVLWVWGQADLEYRHPHATAVQGLQLYTPQRKRLQVVNEKGQLFLISEDSYNKESYFRFSHSVCSLQVTQLAPH